MENMFNLEQSITDWRQQMLAAGIQSPVPLEELETHLREEIAQMMNSGLGGAEAFQLAVQQIGPAQPLRNEFKKAGTSRPSLNWKLFEVLFQGYTVLYPVLVGGLVFVFKNGVFSEMTASRQISSLAAAVSFSVFAWSIHWSSGRFPAVRTNQIRDAILIPVMLWLVTFAYLIMPHLGLAESQRAVISLWGFAPFGIVLGWVWGFTTAKRKATAIAAV